MNRSKSITKLILFLPLFLSILYADTPIEQRIDQVGTKLDKKFFKIFLSKKKIQEAYQLAQEEDFTLGKVMLITDEMLQFTRKGEWRWNHDLKKIDGTLRELQQLESDIRGLTGQAQQAALQKFRYVFLSRIVDHMRYVNGLKPTTKLSLSLISQYDDNINRVAENAMPSASYDPTEKSDWQHTLMANFIWKPFVNHKEFSKKHKFTQSFNAIHITQARNKKNEVEIFDTESKITRDFNSFVKSGYLAYRFQHFSLSLKNSRQTPAYFRTHRGKVGLQSKNIPLKWSAIYQTSTKLDLSFTGKTHFDQTKNGAKDAKDVRVALGQNFKYKWGKNKNSFGIDLEYADYGTDNSASSEYDYINVKLNHKHSHKFDFYKYPFKFTEKFSYRLKNWDQFSAGTKQEEDFIGIAVKVSSKVYKKTKADISIKHNWKGNDRTGRSPSSFDAKQFQVAFGLNWSTP